MLASLAAPARSNKKPVWRKNGNQTPQRVISSFTTWTYLSGSSTTGQQIEFNGGDRIKDITDTMKYHWTNKTSSTTVVLQPARICVGQTSQTAGENSEMIGFDYGNSAATYLPAGMYDFWRAYRYMRVRKVRVTVETRPHWNLVTTTEGHYFREHRSPVMFGAVIARSDEGIPSFTGGDTNTRGTPWDTVPGFIRWVHFPNSGDKGVMRSQFKTFEIDIAKLFNDVEFDKDPPEGGSFWLDNTTTTDEWNKNAGLYPQLKLYGKLLNPTNDAAISCYFSIGVKFEWICEFDRGNVLTPGECSVTTAGAATNLWQSGAPV